jgi:hypothetical protein
MAKLCAPRESPVSVTGEEQANAAVASFEHVVVTPPWPVHEIVTEVADVVTGG